MSGTFLETGTVLDRILARTVADVKARKKSVPAEFLEEGASFRSQPLSLKRSILAPDTSVIAEIKRASPSRGRFPVEIEPSAVAAEYVAGGAAAISVLTDEPFFQGSMIDLITAAGIAHQQNIPVLRKDFIVDDYQVLEALAIGADAVLLIVVALEQSLLRSLLETTREYGLEALVEVHDEGELQRANEAGAEIIGVNNRDLRTFEVDLATTERLAEKKPNSTVLVGESGIYSRDDVLRLERAGVDAVLVGESLILADDRAAAIRDLRGET
jgi:indole-3-glycerol phosphate synthase